MFSTRSQSGGWGGAETPDRAERRKGDVLYDACNDKSTARLRRRDLVRRLVLGQLTVCEIERSTRFQGRAGRKWPIRKLDRFVVCLVRPVRLSGLRMTRPHLRSLHEVSPTHDPLVTHFHPTLALLSPDSHSNVPNAPDVHLTVTRLERL